MSPSGFSSPEHPEPISVPADEGLGLKDNQRSSPMWPNPHEQQPNKSVGTAELGPASLAFEHYQLIT